MCLTLRINFVPPEAPLRGTFVNIFIILCLELFKVKSAATVLIHLLNYTVKILKIKAYLYNSWLLTVNSLIHVEGSISVRINF